jgi:hypothetical protein
LIVAAFLIVSRVAMKNVKEISKARRISEWLAETLTNSEASLRSREEDFAFRHDLHLHPVANWAGLIPARHDRLGCARCQGHLHHLPPVVSRRER